MAKEFEMKKSAAAYARTKQDKTGIINPLKLHGYKFNDDIFKRISVTPDGKKVQQGFSAPAGYAHGGEVMQGLGFTEKDITPENVGILLQNANDAVNVLQGYQAAFNDKFKADEKSRMELAKKSQQNTGLAV